MLLSCPPGMDASMLLQPFRKPKRIRTAFSPSQLLRLEHAFEKNHYVVGQERKDLAVSLSLTETQVGAFQCLVSLHLVAGKIARQKAITYMKHITVTHGTEQK